ncbi:MAG: hypothetical protein H6730_16230 [Deltaproteobacteria bacterium]|nr:hypothetical protein [Deltaproteobacteria bacterium]
MATRWGLILLAVGTAALTGCVLPELDLAGRPCPCAPGWSCQADVCVRGEVDAAVDPPDSGAPDTGVDGGVSLDADVPEAGPDTGVPEDGGAPDAGFDGGPDGGALDALPDTGVDAGPVDTGVDAGPSPVACFTDAPCDPPRTVCAGGFCAPGCANGGPACTGGATCDGATGRCFDPQAGCAVDAECGDGAPYQVCEDRRCRYACGVPSAAGCVGDRRCTAGGSCQVAPTCGQDADCGDSELVCTAGHCTRRCELTGAWPCLGGSSCSASTGRCEGASPLGQACTGAADCTSGHCQTITSPVNQSFCSRACGSTSDCPLDMSCLPVDGAHMCIPESVFGVQMDDPTGEACSVVSNTCQSLLCPAGACVERCVSDRECEALGTPCVTITITGGGNPVFLHECAAPTATLQPGDVCPNNDNSLCAHGICNRYDDVCQRGCCADADCASNESCLVYDLAFDTPFTTCQPRTGPGTTGLGTGCTSNATCATDNCAPRDPANLAGPKACTTHCCTDFDCVGYPGGARCAPLPAPGTAGRVNYCVPLVP